jgi:hypothetical protein
MSSSGRALIHQTQSDAESDATLLARFARLRDEAAFDELMRRHGAMVLAVSSRMLRQRQDAEDVLQAVFLTLAYRASALRHVRSVAGWLTGDYVLTPQSGANILAAILDPAVDLTDF